MYGLSSMRWGGGVGPVGRGKTDCVQSACAALDEETPLLRGAALSVFERAQGRFQDFHVAGDGM